MVFKAVLQAFKMPSSLIFYTYRSSKISVVCVFSLSLLPKDPVILELVKVFKATLFQIQFLCNFKRNSRIILVSTEQKGAFNNYMYKKGQGGQ